MAMLICIMPQCYKQLANIPSVKECMKKHMQKKWYLVAKTT